MAILYLDFEGGNDANNGTTFALRVKTVTGGITAARSAPGDVVRVMGSPALTSLSTTGVFTNKSSTVTLAAAKNVLITDCETAFTASANVTATADATYFRTGTKSSANSIAAAFTTGLVSYFALGAAKDYSGYQGITLWVMVQTAVLAASTLSIRLCSDVAGVTTVDTLAIPAITALDCWVPVYINKGSALGASIQSIALYADLDPGTTIVYLDNISTTKAVGADCLHLRTLIGKNTANELWWGLREINGTALTIDGTPYNYFGSNQRVGRGYWGTTETVTTYIRDVIVAPQFGPSGGNFALIQESGTAGNLITYSGGWNRTDMTTQTLETWVDGSGGWGTFWNTNAKDFIHMDLINGVRWSFGLYHEATGVGCTFGTVKMGHCSSIGIYFRAGGIASAAELTGYVSGGNAVESFVPASLTLTLLRSISSGLSGSTTSGFGPSYWEKCTVTTLEIRNAAWHGILPGSGASLSHSTFGTITVSDCAQIGLIFGASSTNNLRVGTATSTSNGNQGCSLAAVSGRVIIDSLTCTNNGGEALIGGTLKGGYVTIASLTTSGSGAALGISLGAFDGITEILKSSIAEGTKVGGGAATLSANPYGRVTLRDYLGTVGDHRSWVGGAISHGTLVSETSVRHTASGLAWKLSPTHVFIDSLMPLRVPLITVRVAANLLVTIRLWMRRTNTSLAGKLYCRGGQLTGIPADVESSISAAANTWQEVTVTFTPTQAGTVDLEVLAYDGGSVNSLYFDDLTVLQA